MSFRKLFVFSLVLFMATAFTGQVKKKRIVFFGDSITQAGAEPSGYISLMRDMLEKKGLDKSYELIGAGIGGNKVYDLYLRMEEDVLSKQPDIVLIYIGVNDVWHKTSHGTGTDLDKYEKFYIAIIKKLQAKNIKVAVCTPTVIGEKKDNANPQDKDLNAYSEVIRRLAATYNCTLIDLRKAFASYEQANNNDNKESGLLTTDRVHLTDTGNQLVADEVIRALTIQ